MEFEEFIEEDVDFYFKRVRASTVSNAHRNHRISLNIYEDVEFVDTEDFYRSTVHEEPKKTPTNDVYSIVKEDFDSFDSCEPISRPRTTSFSSYFAKKRTVPKVVVEPVMESTEQFWNKYRRKKNYSSLSTLMKNILFPLSSTRTKRPQK